ncbi:hypothetical protein MmiHf6_06530 [Methanimicrococcus hongohii]|uniref:Uncharacterized protein n=2 Tax=Methanimicrococcus hongohii TaxID=3028295 RepID=A0AA96ZTL4_9EURY|nr:hypothetical protein MmiHf6_06530 [Methanimicrococcus sp. Hf6]
MVFVCRGVVFVSAATFRFVFLLLPSGLYFCCYLQVCISTWHQVSVSAWGQVFVSACHSGLHCRSVAAPLPAAPVARAA